MGPILPLVQRPPGIHLPVTYQIDIWISLLCKIIGCLGDLLLMIRGSYLENYISIIRYRPYSYYVAAMKII